MIGGPISGSPAALRALLDEGVVMIKAFVAVCAYAQHRPGCAARANATSTGKPRPCDCGLDAALAALPKPGEPS